MDGDTAAILDDFFRGFTGTARPFLLLDFDGTLAPFRVDRYKAQPWAGVRELLALIQNQGRTRMVVVTGRPAGEIVPLLDVHPSPEVWGLHGAERLHPDGRRELEEPSATAKAKLKALREQLRQNAFGGLLEEKPNAVAMHWRGAGPKRSRTIAAKTRALFEPIAKMDGLSLLEFESGLELRAGRDKGGAVAAILEEDGGGAAHPAAYLGDDVTDENAFLAIKERGLGILVRRAWRETAAKIWLKPPEELREFLMWWLRACRSLESGQISN